MLPAELTVAQVASLIGCSVDSVKRRIYRGEIKAHRVGAHWRVWLHELKKHRDMWDAIEARAALGGG
jgi:excisionase family DNA binding protein